MVVKDIFKDVEYPEDKKSIEHIIREYDMEIDNSLKQSEFTRAKYGRGQYLLHIFSVICILCIFSVSESSLIVKCLYSFPPIIFLIYYLVFYIRLKRKGNISRKMHYKLNILDGIFLCMYFYVGIFTIDSILLDCGFGDREYIISFCVLMIVSFILGIITRIRAPKKFIKNFQYKERKLFTENSVVASITSLLVIIAYSSKPYKLVVVMGYILIVILISIIPYKILEYKQYDKIEELKKQINYVSKK